MKGTKGPKAREKITWLASYPKSGNTWLRSFLYAYQNDGRVNINQLGTIGSGDMHPEYMRIVSPLELEHLGLLGQQMLRSSMLLHQLVMWPFRPFYVKSHVANVVPPKLGPLISPYVTERAVYIVRDPRDVFLSTAAWLNLDKDVVIKNFNDDLYCIGMGEGAQLVSQLCSWSTHVKSWTQEKDFPVLVLRYEDMLKDPVTEFTKVVEFVGINVVADRVIRSVDACHLGKLSAQEEEHGFVERRTDNVDKFFNGGGSKWENELDAKYVAQIETDHHAMMTELGYELSTVPKLKVV